MDRGPLHDTLTARFDSLTPQLQAAARYVLDWPQEVALRSMREQARAAGVQPATMTRLAQALGLPGYDAVRRAHADALRHPEAPGFSPRAGAQLAGQRAHGEAALVDVMLAEIADRLEDLRRPRAVAALVAAARRIAGAEHCFCLGLRGSYPVAVALDYALGLAGASSRLLDSARGTGLDPLTRAGTGDVLVAVSVDPYTRATVEAARLAAARGVPIVAMTDSPASPLAALAAELVLAPPGAASFLPAMAPAFAAAEALGALVAGLRGEAAVAALAATDAHLGALATHLQPRRRRGPRAGMPAGGRPE